MVLVSDVLEHIGWIYSPGPLNLANMKVQNSNGFKTDWRIYSCLCCCRMIHGS